MLPAHYARVPLRLSSLVDMLQHLTCRSALPSEVCGSLDKPAQRDAGYLHRSAFNVYDLRLAFCDVSTDRERVG